MIRNNNDGIWVHETKKGVLLLQFSRNSCDSPIVRNLFGNIFNLKGDIDKILRA